MQEKVKTKIANVDASLMRGKDLINEWLTQQFDSGVHVYALVCLLGVDTLNIFCDWNKLCDLLSMTSSVFVIKLSIDFFLQKLRWAKLFYCKVLYKVRDNNIKVW